MVADSSVILLDLGQPSNNLPDMNLVAESGLGNLGCLTVLGSYLLGCLDVSRMRKKMTILTRKERKETDITLACTTCGIRYCDSSSQSWIQCQNYEAWLYNACLGLDEKGPATFICILCTDYGARRRRRSKKKKN
jgi:hypothetical protein